MATYSYIGTVDTIANGVGGTLNLRSAANSSAAVVAKIPDKTTIGVDNLSGTWLAAKYGIYTGYVMAKFIKESDEYKALSSGSDSGGSSGNNNYSIQAIIDTAKHGNGGTVNLRSKPWKSASQVISIGNGNTIFVKNITGTWLPAKYGSKTGFIMAKFIKGTTAYNMTGNETFGSGNYGPFYTGNRKLSDSEKEVNAQYILNYLRANGWTKNAVCGVLGNMQVESYLSPGVWQSLNADVDTKGFGLTQWTPATKFFEWACAEGYLYDDIDAQIKRILYEVANPSLQWSSSKAGMSFSDFTHSTDSAANLSTVFCKGYEKPKNPDYSTRSNYATSWYSKLI